MLVQIVRKIAVIRARESAVWNGRAVCVYLLREAESGEETVFRENSLDAWLESGDFNRIEIIGDMREDYAEWCTHVGVKLRAGRKVHLDSFKHAAIQRCSEYSQVREPALGTSNIPKKRFRRLATHEPNILLSRPPRSMSDDT